MTTASKTVLILCIAGALGAWLMQQPQDVAWGHLLTPWNLGSLIVGVCSTVGAALGVKPAVKS